MTILRNRGRGATARKRSAWTTAAAAAAAMFAAGGAGAARAQTAIPIVGASFEAPALPPGAFAVASPPPGWTDYGFVDHGYRSTGVLNPAGTTLYPGPAPDGAQVGVVFLWNVPANPLAFSGLEAGLQQTLPAVLSSGRRYELTVEIGDIAPYPPHGFAFSGFPGYRIELLAGGAVLAADESSAAPPEGGFATATLRFDVSGAHPLTGAPLGIRLVNRNAGPGLEVNFDDVRLTETPIAVWASVGNGVGGAAGAPSLAGVGSLLPGETATLTCTGGPASAPVWFVFGFETLFAPLLGGVLVPAPLFWIESVADSAGVATLDVALATALPPAFVVYAQALTPDAAAPQGLAMSAGLSATAP